MLQNTLEQKIRIRQDTLNDHKKHYFIVLIWLFYLSID
jgi:hypothetical protein